MARLVRFVTAVLLGLVFAPAALSQARVDALGDPLPEGAIARLGTTRMRHFSSPDQYCWGIGSIAWSPDGKRIATTSYADKIGIEARLWEAATGKPLSVLENNLRYGPSLVRFAPDGRTLAAAARDKIVLWETTTGKELAQLVGHSGEVDSLVFQDGGRTMVSVSRDGTVHWWDIASRKALRRWHLLADDPRKTAKGDPIGFRGSRHACFSADGNTLALSKWWATQPNEKYPPSVAVVFDLRARKELWRDDLSQYECRFAFTPDGKRLVLSWASCLRLRDTVTGRPLSDVQHLLAWGIDFSPDGKTLAARVSGGIAFWSPHEKTPARQYDLPRHNGCSRGPAVSPDGKRVAIEIGRVLQVLDVASGKPVVAWPSYDEGFRRLAFSADGRDLLINNLTVDTATWRPRKASADRSHQFKGVRAVSLNRTLCVAVDDKHEDALFDMKTGRLLARLQAPPREPGFHGGFFSPNAKYYVMQDCACADKEVDTVFAIPKGKRLWQLSLNGHVGTDHWTFSANEARVAFVDRSTGTIDVRDTATGELQRRFGSDAGSGALALSPQGDRLAAWVLGSYTVHIWDVRTGQRHRSLVLEQETTEHDQACMLWSADSRMLMVGGLDNAVRLWEVASGRVRREFRGHLARATCLALSPDGQLLASGSDDTTLLIWKTRPEK